MTKAQLKGFEYYLQFKYKNTDVVVVRKDETMSIEMVDPKTQKIEKFVLVAEDSLGLLIETIDYTIKPYLKMMNHNLLETTEKKV